MILKVKEHIGFVTEIWKRIWYNILKPFCLIMPYEIRDYLLSSGKKIILKMKYKIEKLFYVVIGVCII